MATWGDPYYLGLTGIEVVDGDGDAIPLKLDMLHADPRDLHVLPGYERDDRTLDKYVACCYSDSLHPIIITYFNYKANCSTYFCMF